MIWLIPITVLYALVMITWAIRWKNMATGDTGQTGRSSVTVITAMRNESGRIQGLIESLKKQTWPQENWTFLLIDDHSTDGCFNEAEVALENSGIDHKMVRLPQHIEGKKAAIHYAVKQAATEWILTTDADCRMGPDWIAGMMSEADDHLNMLTGPVQYEINGNWFKRFLYLDLASMIGIGAVTLRSDINLMNNAANMAFRRSVFLELDPYAKDGKASGDDVYLLKHVARAYPGSIRFVRKQEVMVTTLPPASLNAFIQQRIRWASKVSSTMTGTREFLLVSLIYITNCILLLSPIWLLWGDPSGNWMFYSIALGLKLLSDCIFFSAILPFFRKTHYLFYVLPTEILHVPYVVLFGLAGLKKTYRWKSRKLK